MQYEISTEVEKVARVVIKEHLHELGSKKIVYITQEKKDDKTGVAVAQMRKGKPILGDIKIIGGLNAFLASGEDRTDHNGPTPFPCLVVSRHAWNLLKPEQRKAFVHQQLNRLDYDTETGKPSLLDYDVKEFSVIAKLYGDWNDDLSTFFKAAKQYPLFETETQPAAAAAKVVKPGNGKAEAAKANGNGSGNGNPPASNIGSLKEHVARKRGRQTARQ